VEHGEDLGEEARAVDADELEQAEPLLGRRVAPYSPRQCVGGRGRGGERRLEAREQLVGVGDLPARGVSDVEDVHEPPAVVRRDVPLPDADAVVGERGHGLEQHAVLARAVHLDERRRLAHPVVHHHPRGVHMPHEELVHLGRMIPLHGRRNPISPRCRSSSRRFSSPFPRLASRDGFFVSV